MPVASEAGSMVTASGPKLAAGIGETSVVTAFVASKALWTACHRCTIDAGRRPMLAPRADARGSRKNMDCMANCGCRCRTVSSSLPVSSTANTRATPGAAGGNAAGGFRRPHTHALRGPARGMRSAAGGNAHGPAGGTVGIGTAMAAS
eukprot:scaffold196669_cov28-Tisochrysis_lutea.AAC.7